MYVWENIRKHKNSLLLTIRVIL